MTKNLIRAMVFWALWSCYDPGPEPCPWCDNHLPECSVSAEGW